MAGWLVAHTKLSFLSNPSIDDVRCRTHCKTHWCAQPPRAQLLNASATHDYGLAFFAGTSSWTSSGPSDASRFFGTLKSTNASPFSNAFTLYITGKVHPLWVTFFKAIVASALTDARLEPYTQKNGWTNSRPTQRISPPRL